MLTTLRIRNLALVAELTLELPPGLVAITGETGAGKSILIGALSLVLGERADRSLLRSGAESGSVEAVFEVSSLGPSFPALLETHGIEPCVDRQLFLKRTFTAAGANRQFINGTPTALHLLAAVGDWLVDMHGPHEHQSLLHPAKQLALLDAFGNLQTMVAALGDLVAQRRALERQKADLVVDDRTYAQQLDLLRFQAGEIAGARLSPDEEATVAQDYQRASNAAKLLQLGQAALNLLSENDTSLMSQAAAVGRLLQELRRVDAGAESLLASLEQGQAALRELQAELGRYLDRVEVDPARLQALEERLDRIHSLKRKYGNTLAAVLAFGEDAGHKLAQLEQRDAELARLNAALERLDLDSQRAARELSAKRRQVIPKLARSVARQLADLGFRQSQFDITLDAAADRPGAETGPAPLPALPSASGLDAVEFQFAPNPGEPARPLRSIASSGELARVMLALKTVLAAQDEIPVLVFDEVDANVGGETANALGAKMREIARRRQVLCITHLPQVAALADAHFVVTKELKGGRTLSTIQALDPAERVTELARMLGGQTEPARRHAAALLAGRS